MCAERLRCTEVFLVADSASGRSVPIDLKDAYFHTCLNSVTIRSSCTCTAYQYSRLPFSFSLAPHTLSKCEDVALEPTHREMWLLGARSPAQAMCQAQRLTLHILCLGFANWEKCMVVPSQMAAFFRLTGCSMGSCTLGVKGQSEVK